MKPPQAIGVFDSGIGGLTVLRAIRQALPNESLVYLGDTARVPYGNKSKETVVRYALESAQFLLARGVKALVVACNTSTAFALPLLVEQMPVPVIGVIDPGARAAIARSRIKRIAVIATAGTVDSQAYVTAVQALDPTVHVISRACPLFVPLVEEGWIDTEATRLIVAHYLEPLRAEQVDTLILGCTHYPLLTDAIRRVMGPKVMLIDSGPAVAAALRETLAARNILASAMTPGSVQLYVTDGAAQFAGMSRRVLNGDAAMTLATVSLPIVGQVTTKAG